MTTYSYSLSGDFSSGISVGQFHAEIVASSINDVLSGVFVDGDDVDIVFDTSLTSGEVTTLNSLVSAHTPGGEPVEEVSPGEVFGSQYAYAEQENPQVSTEDDSFQQALRLTTPDVPAGTYRIGWYYEWAADATNEDFIGRIQLDNSTTIAEHRQEPKDSGGSDSSGSGTDQRHNASGFRHVQLTAGVHNFDLDYLGQDDDYEVTVYRCRFEFWRVQ